MIQATINQRVVVKPDKLLSPSATPYRESMQKIPGVIITRRRAQVRQWILLIECIGLITGECRLSYSRS
jgi:hypothetical protein